jgi:raffinose/stachyose/melibiose transport system substrate-binding protein
MKEYTVGTLSRRQVLQGVTGLLAMGMAGGLTACGGSGDAREVTAWIYRPEYRKAIDEIVDAFIRAHPAIKVDMGYKPLAQYQTLLKTALVGGAAPDALATNGAAGIWGDTGADNDYILPLDGKIPLDDLHPSVAKTVQYKGHVYGAPVQIFKIGIYYQRPIFEKHGLQPPNTWNELLSLSKTLSDMGMPAWSMPAQDMIIPFFFYHLAVNSILGAKGYEELTTGKRKLTDPDLLPAAQLLVDMSQHFNPGYKAVAYAEGKALFAQGKTAMVIGGSSDYAGFLEIDPKIDVGFFGFPSPKGTAPIALSGLSMAYVVNKNAARKDDAVAFVSWLTSLEAQKLVLQHLGLPSRKDVTPQGDDARSRAMRSILEVPETPSWLDFPVTGNTSTAAYKDGAGIFTGRLSPMEFAQVLQDSIKPEQPS